MTSAPLGPVILRLAAPMVLCMLVTGLYNMADTFLSASWESPPAIRGTAFIVQISQLMQ